MIALAAIAVDGVEVAAQGGDRDREPEAALVGVVGVAAVGLVGDAELVGRGQPAAVDRPSRDSPRSPQVGEADPAEDLGAAAVGGPRQELVAVGAAAVEGDGSRELLVQEEAEVALEAVGGADAAGGREVIALAAIAVDGVEVVHEAARDVAGVRAAGVLHGADDSGAEVELVGQAVGVAVGGARDRAVQVVAVDVDRDPAIGLGVAAAVLADPLVVAPVAVGNVRVVGGASPVPVGDPDVVGHPVVGAIAAGKVADARAGAAVDPGDVIVLVQSPGPRGQEPQRGPGVRGASRVVLHIEVDGRAWPQPQRPRVRNRVAGSGPALRLRLAAVDRGAVAAGARRLQSDVNRHEGPAIADLAANPAGRQVRLAASAVDAAYVDPDRAVRRRRPGGHGGLRRRGARVESEPLVVGAARGAGLGRVGLSRRARSRGRLGAGHEGRAVEDSADQTGMAPPRRRDDHAGGGHLDPKLRGSIVAWRGSGPRLDQNRLAATHRVGRTPLIRAWTTEIHGVPIEPHAGRGVLGEVVDRPGRGHLDLIAPVADLLDGGAPRCCGGTRRRRAGHRRGDRRVRDARSSPARRSVPWHAWRVLPAGTPWSGQYRRCIARVKRGCPEAGPHPGRSLASIARR